MVTNFSEVRLKLEIDSPIETDQIEVGTETNADGVSVTVTGRESGHGFGLSEVIEVLVVVGAGVASDVAADVLRRSVGALIRKVKGRDGSSDGSRKDIARLLDSERNIQSSDDTSPPPGQGPQRKGHEGGS